MALVSVPVFNIPEILYSGGGTPNGTNAQVAFLSNDTSIAGIITVAPKTGFISRVALVFHNIFTSSVLDVKLETVVNSLPSGTLIHADAFGTIDADTVGEFKWVELNNPVEVTRGQVFSITIYGDGIFQQGLRGLSNFPPNQQNTYVKTASTGSNWASGAANPMALVEYQGGIFHGIPGLMPVTRTLITQSFNSGTNPNTRGVKFRLPCTVSMSGGWAGLNLPAAADIILYAGDGETIIKTVNVSREVLRDTAGRSPIKFKYDQSLTLEKDLDYYLAIKPVTATSISIYSLSTNIPGSLKQWSGSDMDMIMVTAQNPAGVEDWTEDELELPIMGLEIDGIDTGSPLNSIMQESASVFLG